jgi:hypothetical protein
MVPEPKFWHNCGMPNRAEQNAATPDAVLPPAHPESALASVPAPLRTPIPASASVPALASAPALSANDPNASPRPRELGGPTGPEPTRFGDWEKKGRCIDF